MRCPDDQAALEVVLTSIGISARHRLNAMFRQSNSNVYNNCADLFVCSPVLQFTKRGSTFSRPTEITTTPALAAFAAAGNKGRSSGVLTQTIV
eukprot:scaffold30735_cov19-Tisochrysis_lutea.AAC.2